MTERIAVVGGGTGGTVLANALAERLSGEIDAGEVAITLFDATPEHVYKPVWLYVAFGKREPEDGRRPLREVLDDRVELRIARVTGIDHDARRLDLAEGAPAAYDRLVLATGANVAPERVPGLAAGAHDFYTERGAERLREELLSLREGHVVLNVASAPHMCPAAPLEFVFVLDDWLRERGLREDVDVTYTYPVGRVHGNEQVAEWARPRLERRGIDIEAPFNIASVAPGDGVVSSEEGTTIDYDLLVTVPPHEGSELVADAGLGEGGWVDVDPHTLEAHGVEGLYALGDVAATGVPKAGSAAHYQAKTLAERIADHARRRPSAARYDGKTLCFVETGTDRATFLEFDYDSQPDPGEPSRAIHWSKLAYNESYWLTARGLI